MSWVLYWPARALVAFLQMLPLQIGARLGRALALIWWMLDFKHRGLVQRNLKEAFPEKSDQEVRSITRKTFQRIAENSFAAVKTASMKEPELLSVCEIVGLEKLPRKGAAGAPTNVIGAVGHFGNFELYARTATPATGWQGATTYRGMNQPALDALVQKLRARSGCLFFERRKDARALREALGRGGIFLGLLSDQSPHKGGVLVPFMGRMCATTTAPALFALRYDAPLFPVICYRVAIGRWRIEVGDEIPLRENSGARSAEAIMTDVNRAFEAAIRRDPANWFWVHNRWKKARIKRAPGAPAADPAAGVESPSA
jgi:KDO2-lipid IV(A) lauroyltransferase